MFGLGEHIVRGDVVYFVTRFGENFQVARERGGIATYIVERVRGFYSADCAQNSFVATFSRRIENNIQTSICRIFG